ncbi:Rv2640c family ArsR-like transcriptional regulator [Rhodococcus chondri]|uniref:Rv2640c family ArsR-like transcriptional regulator n=1 Tax=Rhodococcus chondri TaxID=3065941 RepID=A0ABU7JZ77_9NOCA|nr:Rv2640c family ArsR-like transcriptional regulator [Rhodococcus sp. CC-R104]MEE2035323.1 Rv2640c family ArsR-like transcriptional regulator [Rhodococcus sp. CC-R104]
MPKALPVLDVSAPICCAPMASVPISDDDALHLALRLKALADPVRLKLMSILLTGDDAACTCDLAAAVDLSESTVSHHLGKLRNAGMIASERRGMNVYHRVHHDALAALGAVLNPGCCR